MNHLPNVPKKSLPKKGNPGLFARTIILKSGWMTITFSLPSAWASSGKEIKCITCIFKLCNTEWMNIIRLGEEFLELEEKFF